MDKEDKDDMLKKPINTRVSPGIKIF